MQEIETKILSTEVLITNCADSEIAPIFAEVGYPAAEISKGSALLSDAKGLIANRVKESAEQLGATQQVYSRFESMKTVSNKTFKLARIEFEGDIVAEKTLGLRGVRKTTISEWLHQTTIFYTNLTGTLLERMINIGYSPERISNEYAQLQELIMAESHQQKQIGEAQEATLERDAKLEELFAWAARLRRVAKIVLEEHPQMSERLGILDRS